MTRQLRPIKWRLAHSWRSVLCTQLLYLFANESLHFPDDGSEDGLELSTSMIVIDSSASNKTYTLLSEPKEARLYLCAGFFWYTWHSRSVVRAVFSVEGFADSRFKIVDDAIEILWWKGIKDFGCQIGAKQFEEI